MEKKNGPFLGFLSNGAVYSFFPPISGFTPGSAWRPGRHRNSLLRCGSVRRPPGKRSSPKKRGGSTARFWFSRFDEVMIFFVVFTFEKTMLDQYEMCIYLYHMYIYIYMIYNDYTCPNRIGERFTLSRESYVRSILGNAIIRVDSSSKCCKSSEIK